MASKTPVTAADLFVLLDREFRRRKPRECAGCFVQLPYPIDVFEEGPNWEAINPAHCDLGCVEIFEELVLEFQQLYSLRTPAPTERA